MPRNTRPQRASMATSTRCVQPAVRIVLGYQCNDTLQQYFWPETSLQDTIENQLKQARTDASKMIKSSSHSFQDKAQTELTKLDKELDAKIEQSSATIEKSKNDSVLQIQNQINEITKLTLSKVAAFDVSDDEIKSAIKSTERSIN